MFKKILFPVLLLASLASFSQTYIDSISISGLPPNQGQILDVIDFNNDGFEDVVYQNSATGPIKLYRNTNGFFTDITNIALLPVINGSEGTGVLSFDYNNDGFQDLLISRAGLGGFMRLFKNNCGSNFTEVSSISGMPSRINIISNTYTADPIILISDYNKNNTNDILFGMTLANGNHVIALLKNLGGVFSIDSDLITGFSATPYFALIDYNNDLSEDILVITNANINTNATISLYDNNGSGIYSVITTTTGLINSSPVGFATIWDWNHDGYMDILLGTKEVVLPGSSNNGNRVFTNNGGDGTFTNSTATVNTYQGANTGDNYASHVFDAENDGDYDVLWEINKNTGGSSTPALMINTPGNIFINRQAALLPSASVSTNAKAHFTVFDYNNDGVQDIFKFGAAGGFAGLYKGAATTNKYINIKLISCGGQADPRGTRVKVSAANKIQYKTYSSQNSNTAGINGSDRLHFGIGTSTVIDTIEVFWANGNSTILLNVNPNQNLVITDGACTIGVPLVYDLGTDTLNVCNQDTAYLLAPSGFVTYVWSNGSTTPDTKTTVKGWYYSTVTNADGCSAIDSIYVIFGKARILQGDTQICLGKSITLDASPRFDCSPFGAPANKPVTEGQDLGPNYQYAGKFNGHFYYRARTRSTWSQAAKAAQLLGGFLAVINDGAEQSFIESNGVLAGLNLWLGLYRTASTQQFIWSNCDSLTFTNWASINPSPDPAKNFVFMENDICPDARKWKNIIDDNSGSPDPCDNTVFALVEFDAATNVTYLWSNGGTTASTVVSPVTNTPYNVMIKQNGSTCFGTVNINVIDVNNLFPSDSISECKASFVVLAATAGMASYRWSTGSTNPFIFVFNNGWYKVSVVSPEGCIGIDSVYALIYNASIRTPDTAVCLGTPVFLRGPTPAFAFSSYYGNDFQVKPFSSFNNSPQFNFNGTKTLGPLANDSITLSLSGLPLHDSVEISFDLYIHDTWEGNCNLVGPDFFRVKNGAANLINTTFSNNSTCTQSFPSLLTAASNPSTTGAILLNLPKRCDARGVKTTLYRITKRFRHSNFNLDLSFLGDLKDTFSNSNGCNESWSLDNLNIQLRQSSNVLWSTGDTTQNIFVLPIDPTQDYWVRVPVGGSFCYDTVTVSTFTGNLPFDLLFQDTSIICNSPSDTLNLPSGYSKYTWSTGDVSQGSRAYNTGWYLGHVETMFGGCTGLDSIFINKGPFSIKQTDTSICFGNSITLNADLHNNCNPFGAPANTSYIAAQAIAGYTYKGEYHGHHYYLADTHSNWSLAAQSALAQGGHLACINDTLEQNFIASIVDSNAWLGLFRNGNGYHNWMNCDSLTYTNWAPGEPSATPEDYVFMTRFDCVNPKMWNSYIDDDVINPDQCLSNIFGLLEIEPFYYKFSWLPNGETTDSIVVLPTIDTRYRLRISRDQSNTSALCNAGNIEVKVINEFFDIIPDSASKFNCNGDTVLLEAKAGFSNYNWNNGETTQFATYKDYVGWAYCFYDNGTCKFTDSVYINVPAAFKRAAVLTNISCYGLNDGIATAGATGGVLPYTVLWQIDASIVPLKTNLSPGKYAYVIMDSLGCIQYDTVTITNPDSALVLNIQTLKSVSCNNDTNAVLYPLVYGGEMPYTATWVGIPVSDTLKNIGAGLYTYTITDARGCTITQDLVLTDPDLVKISALVLTQIMCADDSNGVVKLSATGGTQPYHFAWNSLSLNSPDITKVTRGDFKAIVMDTNACFDTIIVTMVPSDANTAKCDLMIPQGFTPNGDGRNDIFYIKGLLDFADNELTVFNRWGETVYTKVNYANDWDGKPNKTTLFSSGDGFLPTDTYFYVLTTKANNKTYSGYVYLTK
ncbi:MAG: VCBS repeat-containing protein [Bacteroidia bacterium]|nr:VCBS repeat-containing protein [Bacteroidia bacterium]